jgi:hypothetical protein
MPVVCALALALAAGTGCEDDDGGGDNPEVVESGGAGGGGGSGSGSGSVTTNTVATTNSDGSISIVTNLVFIPVTLPPLKLPAPKLIAPANGEVFLLFPPATERTVTFQWEDVAGADDYQLAYKVDGAPGYSTIRFYSWHAREWKFSAGTYSWFVTAILNDQFQTPSAVRKFTVK